jgi:hypothetical protein
MRTVGGAPRTTSHLGGEGWSQSDTSTQYPAGFSLSLLWTASLETTLPSVERSCSFTDVPRNGSAGPMESRFNRPMAQYDLHLSLLISIIVPTLHRLFLSFDDPSLEVVILSAQLIFSFSVRAMSSSLLDRATEQLNNDHLCKILAWD